jgi:hypothetical protein
MKLRLFWLHFFHALRIGDLNLRRLWEILNLKRKKERKKERKKVKRRKKAKLDNVSVIHPRGLGSNLSTERKYFLILFVSHLNSNL